MRTARAIAAAGWLLVAVLWIGATDASSSEPEGCTRISLGPQPPNWISTAQQIPWSGGILVVDPSPDTGKLLLYNAALELQDTFRNWSDIGSASASDEVFRPLTADVSPDQRIRLRLAGLEPVWLAPDLHLAMGADPFGSPDHAPPAPARAAFYINSGIAPGGYVVGYGALVQDPGQDTESFEVGFLGARIERERSRAEDPVLLFPHADSDYYLLGYNYFALTTDGAFGVFLNENAGRASLVRLLSGGFDQLQFRELPETIIPEAFRRVPQLKGGQRTQGDAPSTMAQFENSSVIAGLFGQPNSDDLFLLTRSNVAGSTEWVLHHLDMHHIKVLASYRLPTTSPHLTVAPGDQQWILFERGFVKPDGSQEISTAVSFPSSWLSPSSSPLLKDQGFIECNRR